MVRAKVRASGEAQGLLLSSCVPGGTHGGVGSILCVKMLKKNSKILHFSIEEVHTFIIFILFCYFRTGRQARSCHMMSSRPTNPPQHLGVTRVGYRHAPHAV